MSDTNSDTNADASTEPEQPGRCDYRFAIYSIYKSLNGSFSLEQIKVRMATVKHLVQGQTIDELDDAMRLLRGD